MITVKLNIHKPNLVRIRDWESVALRNLQVYSNDQNSESLKIEQADCTFQQCITRKGSIHLRSFLLLLSKLANNCNSLIES